MLNYPNSFFSLIPPSLTSLPDVDSLIMDPQDLVTARDDSCRYLKNKLLKIDKNCHLESKKTTESFC